MQIKKMINGREVWITVEEIFEERDDGSLVATGRCYGAFKFDQPPGVTVGESVKDDQGRTRDFATKPEAAKAAAAAPAARLTAP